MTITGISAIIYDNMGEPYYLIFRRASNWKGWEFLKGKIKDGETPESCVDRVFRQDAGISQFKIVKRLEKTRKYKTPDGKEKELAIFLVEANMNIPVRNYKSSKKHDSYIWAKSSEVMTKLTWENEKTLFREIDAEIKKQEQDN
ncbi:MAG: NUDIX domain-containing protein [Candidatus Woesearchaeota archaeon]